MVTDITGITQKWHKLRQRCASYKATSSGPSSLDSDTNYIVTTDQRAAYTMLPASNRQTHHFNNTSVLHDDFIPPPPPNFRDDHYHWQAEKYDYRDVNLNGTCMEKVNHKRIPLPGDYWQHNPEANGIVLADVEHHQVWCPNRNGPMRKSRELLAKDTDWEYNVYKYENLGDRERLKYYTATDDNGNRKNSLEKEHKKDIKFLGIKAFKSASMRLPGQKSSIQEVQQLLRNKFNKINAGLRKRRALSVQEVFHRSSSQPPPAVVPATKIQKPSQFYVPTPVDGENAITNNNYKDSDNGPTSLPYFVNSTTPAAEIPKRPNRRSTDTNTKRASPHKHSNGGTTQDDQDYVDGKRTILRSHSHRVTNNNLCTDLDKDQACETAASSTQSSSPSKMPQFVVGGCVTLRDRCNTTATTVATKTKECVTNKHNVPNGCSSVTARTIAATKEKIRLRPRSHSPLKHFDADAATTAKQKAKKNRESFGFFERFNRIMSINHLPPPHSSSGHKSSKTTLGNGPAKNEQKQDEVMDHKITVLSNGSNRNANDISGGDASIKSIEFNNSPQHYISTKQNSSIPEAAPMIIRRDRKSKQV